MKDLEKLENELETNFMNKKVDVILEGDISYKLKIDNMKFLLNKINLIMTDDKENQIITIGELAFGIAQIFFIVMLALLSNAIVLYGLIVGLVFALGMLILKKPMKLEFGNCLIPSLIYAFLLASNVGGSLIWLIRRSNFNANPTICWFCLLYNF